MEAPMVRRVGAPSPRVALAVAAAVVLLVLLWLGRSVITPFVIGLVLIYILDPAVEWLAARRIPGTRRPVPRGLAVLVVYLLTIFLLVEGISLLLRPLVQQVGEFLENLPAFGAAIDEQLRRLSEAYQALGLPAALR